MKIPASKQEMQMVCESADQLHKSMKNAADIAEQVIEMLGENFLGVDEKLRKKLVAQKERIGAAMWQMNVISYKMQDHQERVVSQEEFEF